MNVDALIAPLSDAEGAEAGPDLGYSDDRSAIEAPFNEDAAGDEVDEKSWRDSIKLILKQVEQTRDLWLAIYLMRGGAKVGDLSTVADGGRMLAGLLENLWIPVHPTLDEADFIGRKTPCDSLTRVREFLNPLRRVVIFQHRQGKVSGEDLERFAAQGAGAEGYGAFRAAYEDKDPERAAEIKAGFVTAVEQFDALIDAIKRTDAVLVANAQGATGTNFTALYDTLDSLRAATAPWAGMAVEAATAQDAGAGAVGGGDGVYGSGGGPALSGRVNSRDDVLRAIDAICEYYQAREPGHPVPVMMKRARHWVGMDFLALLDDLVPESMDSARRLLVSKIDAPPDDNGY